MAERRAELIQFHIRELTARRAENNFGTELPEAQLTPDMVLHLSTADETDDAFGVEMSISGDLGDKFGEFKIVAFGGFQHESELQLLSRDELHEVVKEATYQVYAYIRPQIINLTATVFGQAVNPPAGLRLTTGPLDLSGFYDLVQGD